MRQLWKEMFNKYIPGVVALLFLTAIVVYLIRQDWSSAAYTIGIFLLTLTPRLLKRWMEVYIPIELDAAVGVFIFLTLFLGVSENFYGRFQYWDSIFHFQSGFLLGILGFVLFYILNGQTNKKLHLTPGFISFSAFNFSLAAGVLWEIYEYIADTQFGYDMQHGGLDDTMTDLMLNAASSLIVVVLGYLWMRRTSRIPMTPKKLTEE